jgi:hypothetical protein
MDLSFATQLVLWVQLCLISCVKNQMWVRYEWLMSSSKLQPCLELCQFAQALLKTELQGEKCISLLALARGSNYDILLDGWRITRDTQPKRKILFLDSCCYN